MALKVVVLRNTKTTCSYCRSAACAKVVHNEDTKKVCTFHKGYMPANIQEAIEAALKGGTVVLNG
jgi:Asp-tRNA(Asn)/Glu-tRNA(Gln) amidotransferase B subunit